MSNNYDIRCGLIMSVELNKNYVEHYLNENCNLYFEDKNYNCASERIINKFWKKVNNKAAFLLEDQDENVMEELREAVCSIGEEFGFNFYDEYYESEYDYFDKEVKLKLCSLFKITEDKYDVILDNCCVNLHRGGVYGCDICAGSIDEKDLCEEGKAYCPIYHACS